MSVSTIEAPKSEVAQLRRQIELELEAMQRGMQGLALGAARHEFIRRRMDRVALYQDELALHIGEDRAGELLYNTYVQCVG